MPEEERRISPAVAIVGAGLGLGVLGTVALVALAKAAPPGVKFTLSDLVISPTEVNPGQPVIISCLVTNIGDGEGTTIITLGGDFMAEQVVSLAPGESKVVSFEVVPDIAKTYSVSVDGLYGSFVATEVPVADIRASNLVISPTEVYVGEPVTISVTVTNYGAAAGSKVITCNVT